MKKWALNAAVVGLGITPMGKIYGRSAADFAAEAVALALDDAGLRKSDIDGLLINGNGTWTWIRTCRWRSALKT